VIAATPAKWAEIAFSESGPGLADGQIARARGDKRKALAAFAAARKKVERAWRDKPKDDSTTWRKLRHLMPGLAEKKRQSVRHGARLSSCRLPRTRQRSNLVADLALVYAWTGERDRALEQLEKVATIPGVLGRVVVHTAISASIRAGMICAVISASTRSLPQPKLPADSSSPRKERTFYTLAAVCDRSSRDRKCDAVFGSARQASSDPRKKTISLRE
jgi:hypothetical protein